MKVAEKLEGLLTERAERKTTEELREATKALLNRYGGGRFVQNRDLAERKLTGAGEKYFHALKTYGEMRASRDWKERFEEARARLMLVFAEDAEAAAKVSDERRWSVFDVDDVFHFYFELKNLE